jgi:hypothetical protein
MQRGRKCPQRPKHCRIATFSTSIPAKLVLFCRSTLPIFQVGRPNLDTNIKTIFLQCFQSNQWPNVDWATPISKNPCLNQ